MKDLRSDSRITDVRTVIGTFDYAAPEQLREGPVDARADVYALGGVLYQAITGKVPYPRETAAATMLAHIDSPPPSVLSVMPDASEFLGEVVRRAMAKDPDDRYPSAGDLGRAALAAVQHRAAPDTERSVAAGEASPRLDGATRPSAAARARDRDRPRAVRGPRRSARAAGCALQHRGHRRAPVRAADRRARDRQDAAGDRVRPARCEGAGRALRPLGPRGARALPAVHHGARALRRAPRAPRPAARGRGRAERARAVHPRPAPPRAELRETARATTPRRAGSGCSRASTGCSRTPPASARSCCCSTTCTGPTRRPRCCSGTCCRTPRRCGCWWSAPRATLRAASCSAGCAASGASSRSCCPG